MSAWSLAMNLSMAEHRGVSIFLVTAGVNRASDWAEQKGIPQQGARATSPGDGLQDLAADGPWMDGTDGQGKPASSPLTPLCSEVFWLHRLSVVKLESQPPGLWRSGFPGNAESMV